MASFKKDSIAVANDLLNPKNLKVISSSVIQQLWSGYGTISRLKAIPSTDVTTERLSARSLILKHVTSASDPQKTEGHLRKLISYQVEQYFYTVLAPLMPEDIGVAQALASSSDGSSMAMIITDLRDQYPVACEKRGELDQTQVYAALSWLAKFHGFWWQRVDEVKAKGWRLPPLEEGNSIQKEGVWLNGGYTYLATRRTEYGALQDDEDSEWAGKLCVPTLNQKSSIAELVADVLSPTSSSRSPITAYETLIHGDVKSENLFATSTGSAVAFFDFQYVGLGLGVCDLAKLFTCSVPSEVLEEQDSRESRDMAGGERMLLEFYQRTVQKASGKSYPWELLEMHWKTALVDWLRFQASWGFWGNTDWLESRVRHILKDEAWTAWLLDITSSARA